MKNNSNIQPSLFSLIPDAEKTFAESAFEGFRPTLEKLKKEFSTSSYDWWRSRWYDWLNYGGNETHESWLRKHNLEMAFSDVWELYESEFSQSN